MRLALLFVLLASPLHAQDRAVNWLVAGYAVTASIDIAQTSYGHGLGIVKEQNPLLRPLIEEHGVVSAMAVKSIAHVAVGYTMLRLKRAHPRWAVVLSVAGVALNSYVIYQNAKVLQRGTR